MKKILVVGSLNMDMTAQVENLPKLGETILGHTFYESPGGKGANQAVSAGRLGADVTIIGKVGDDVYGKKLTDNLKINRVKTDGIVVSKEKGTGKALIVVDSNGDNMIVVLPESNSELTTADIDSKIELVKAADMLVLQHEIPLETVKYVLELGKKYGKINILNPAPAFKLDDSILELIDYLVLNETELEIITGRENIPENEYMSYCEKLLDKKVKNIVLTLGEKGGIYINKENKYEYKALKVKAVDTTAAGDSFLGGFLLKLSEEESVENAITYAAGVSALTVTKEGAQNSLPSKDEVEKFLNK